MANRYFFDKRDMKRGFGKYGLIFLVAFVPMVIFNIFAYKYINIRWLIVLLDCVILVAFILVGNVIAKKIFERKDAKIEARRKAREYVNERKKQILEDSYKKIREEKKAQKELKKDESKFTVIEVEDDNVVVEEKSTVTKPNNVKKSKRG